MSRCLDIKHPRKIKPKKETFFRGEKKKHSGLGMGITDLKLHRGDHEISEETRDCISLNLDRGIPGRLK